jgi:peptidoglycan/xylan/chitin deacetylase (PgdA/CDA1 family)
VRPTYLLKSVFPSLIWRKDPSLKKLYLTFDDGPVPEITPWVLDLLKEENIKATFFCVGDNVQKNPEMYQRILNEGHCVGNHTYNHMNGWDFPTKEYLQNIEQCAELVNSSLFRPPYGKLKPSQVSNLTSQYSIIMWDVLSGDYDKNTSPEKCLKNVKDHFRNGSIIVFHDSQKAKENLMFALPQFIKHAKKEGFEFDVLK